MKVRRILMQIPETIIKNSGSAQKRAFVVGDETRICELVSLILEDLGFESMQIDRSGWLVETTDHINPELIVWDLSHEKTLNMFQILSQIRKQVSMKKVKIMLLGGPDVKRVMETYKGEAKVHFCLKPFSPTRFRYEIEQLYKVGG
jgi:DNA-binding NtrC family response regulator